MTEASEVHYKAFQALLSKVTLSQLTINLYSHGTCTSIIVIVMAIFCPFVESLNVFQKRRKLQKRAIRQFKRWDYL